jgi:hypothetical protein
MRVSEGKKKINNDILVMAMIDIDNEIQSV